MTRTKRDYSIRSEINVEINTVWFRVWDYRTESFRDGFNLRVNGNEFDKDIRDYPENTRFAILTGITDTVRDAAALGAKATLSQKWNEMTERATYLTEGKCADGWLRRGGARGVSETSLLYRAIEIVFPSKDAVEVIELMKNDAKKQDVKWPTYMAKILRSKAFADTVAKLRAEETSGIDGDALLDGLFADEDEGEGDLLIGNEA